MDCRKDDIEVTDIAFITLLRYFILYNNKQDYQWGSGILIIIELYIV